MWRKFHVLSATQAFIICAISAAIIAAAFSIVTVSHERTGFFQDFFWPHQFDPLVLPGALFLALFMVLLAYYHLGGLGMLVMSLVSYGTFYSLEVCALYLFSGGVSIGVIGYITVLCLASVFLYLAHTVANASRRIEEAQRRLGLRVNLPVS